MFLNRFFFLKVKYKLFLNDVFLIYVSLDIKG